MRRAMITVLLLLLCGVIYAKMPPSYTIATRGQVGLEARVERLERWVVYLNRKVNE